MAGCSPTTQYAGCIGACAHSVCPHCRNRSSRDVGVTGYQSPYVLGALGVQLAEFMQGSWRGATP